MILNYVLTKSNFLEKNVNICEMSGLRVCNLQNPQLLIESSVNIKNIIKLKLQYNNHDKIKCETI